MRLREKVFLSNTMGGKEDDSNKKRPRGPRRHRDSDDDYVPSDEERKHKKRKDDSRRQEDSRRQDDSRRQEDDETKVRREDRYREDSRDNERKRSEDKRDRDGHRVPSNRNNQNNEKRRRRPRNKRREPEDMPEAIIIVAPMPPPPPPPEPQQQQKKKPFKDRLKEKVDATPVSDVVKEIANGRINDIANDGQKAIAWVEAFCKIPFGKIDTLPITKDSDPAEISQYFDKVRENLDQAVYGMDKVKEEVLNYVAQAISTNNSSNPRVLALAGQPGVGKTAIVRRGFAEALHRKMKCISMGGIRDSSHFVGFDYTYQGSRYGAVVQALIDCGTSNPILYFDELDKISMTNDGMEVQNMLIHLTDPVQNHAFQDKYFAGIDIDLSKAIIVFSYNDECSVHPILKDRIHTIQVPSPTLDEKVMIARKFLLKEVAAQFHIQPEDVVLSDAVAKHIIHRYCADQPGVRTLKRMIESIVMKINTARFLGDKQKYKCFKGKEALKFPITLTEEMCDQLIDEKKKEDKYLHSMYM